MDERLLIKNYSITIQICKKILFWKYTKKFQLNFEQAKVIDVLEYLYKLEGNPINIITRLLNFVSIYSGKKLSRSDRHHIYLNYSKILEPIKNTFFEGCFSKKNVDIGLTGGDLEDGPYLFSSYVMILSEKMNKDPMYILKNYTFNQLEAIGEGLVYNANQTTDKGKRENRLRLQKKKMENRSQEEQEKINNILKTIRAENGTGTN